MRLIIVNLPNKLTLLLTVVFILLSGCSGTGNEYSSNKKKLNNNGIPIQVSINSPKKKAGKTKQKAKQEAKQTAAEKAKQEVEQASESSRGNRYTKKWNIQRTRNKVTNRKGNTKTALNRTTTGTGFFVSEDGFILTNEHVVRNAKNINVHIESKELNAVLIDSNRNNDIALLKINFSSKPLPLSAGKSVHIGEDITVIGFPNISVQGNSQKATFGYINSLFGIQNDDRYFQISSPIQPGNSGSPLINSEGSVIGIVTATLNQRKMFLESGYIAQNVNYALKSPKAIDLLRSNNVDYATKKNNSSDQLSKKDLIQKTHKSIILILAHR